MTKTSDGDAEQLRKFKEAARELEADDDEARFDERVRKLVKHKPVENGDGDRDGS